MHGKSRRTAGDSDIKSVKGDIFYTFTAIHMWQQQQMGDCYVIITFYNQKTHTNLLLYNMRLLKCNVFCLRQPNHPEFVKDICIVTADILSDKRPGVKHA